MLRHNLFLGLNYIIKVDYFVEILDRKSFDWNCLGASASRFAPAFHYITCFSTNNGTRVGAQDLNLQTLQILDLLASVSKVLAKTQLLDRAQKKAGVKWV